MAALNVGMTMVAAWGPERFKLEPRFLCPVTSCWRVKPANGTRAAYSMQQITAARAQVN